MRSDISEPSATLPYEPRPLGLSAGTISRRLQHGAPRDGRKPESALGLAAMTRVKRRASTVPRVRTCELEPGLDAASPAFERITQRGGAAFRGWAVCLEWQTRGRSLTPQTEHGMRDPRSGPLNTRGGVSGCQARPRPAGQARPLAPQVRPSQNRTLPGCGQAWVWQDRESESVDRSGYGCYGRAGPPRSPRSCPV